MKQRDHEMAVKIEEKKIKVKVGIRVSVRIRVNGLVGILNTFLISFVW